MTAEDPSLESPNSEREIERPRSRWETVVWPGWLPTRARLPLIAQITGAFALVAAVTMPQWTVGDPPAMAAPLAAETPGELGTPVGPPAPVARVAPATPARPAHLNLDLRHNFQSVDLTVTVDSKRVLDTKLEGSGKKFGVFGRRPERSYTRTLDLQPGARVVRLHVKNAEEKFEHTRVERFDLGPASVATMRIDIEKSGLSVIADRPAPPQAAAAAPAPVVTGAATPASAPAPTTEQAAQAAQAIAQANHEAQRASSLAALYQTLRSTLIALAGFIASVASGFMFEEYLKSRNLSPFTGENPRSTRGNGNPQAARVLRRRRERRGTRESDISIDAGLS